MLPQFDFANNYWLGQIFWLVIMFGIMYFLMYRYIIPKIKNILQNRDKKITALLTAAEKANKDAKELQSLQEMYAQKLSETIRAMYQTHQTKMYQLKTAQFKEFDTRMVVIEKKQQADFEFLKTQFHNEQGEMIDILTKKLLLHINGNDA